VFEEYSLLGLAVSGFISSTLLPGGSEVLFVYLVNQSQVSPFSLFLTVTLANALGSWFTFATGWYAAHFKCLRIPDGKHPRAQAWIRRYGAWGLLLAWLPIIGDPLCLMAGWFRLPLVLSLMMMLLGKALRYAALWWLAVNVAGI
jgi:membrane protein YqaA with SNARE-associated domain